MTIVKIGENEDIVYENSHDFYTNTFKINSDHYFFANVYDASEDMNKFSFFVKDFLENRINMKDLTITCQGIPNMSLNTFNNEVLNNIDTILSTNNILDKDNTGLIDVLKFVCEYFNVYSIVVMPVNDAVDMKVYFAPDGTIVKINDEDVFDVNHRVAILLSEVNDSKSDNILTSFDEDSSAIYSKDFKNFINDNLNDTFDIFTDHLFISVKNIDEFNNDTNMITFIEDKNED